MTRRKALQTNRKLDIARADNVLDLEVREFGVEAKLLDDSCVFTRRQARVLGREALVDIKNETLDGPTVL